MRSKRAPETMGAILSGVLRQSAERHRELSAIQRSWARLVGKSLAAHTKPVSLSRKRLVVQVDQPGDGFALNYQRPRLLRQLQAGAKHQVEEIIIRPGEPIGRGTA